MNEGVTIGKFCEIEDGVKIGPGTVIKNYVELRKGTIIGDDCYIDSRVSTSGECWIGDRVKLRYRVTVARNVIIWDDVFIAPNVMFINIPFTDKPKKKTIVECGVKIGTGSVINDSVRIVSGTIIGAMSFVRKDILKPGVYAGNPLRKIR